YFQPGAFQGKIVFKRPRYRAFHVQGDFRPRVTRGKNAQADQRRCCMGFSKNLKSRECAGNRRAQRAASPWGARDCSGNPAGFA
ncbi:MAG: hypothetical protein LBN92_00880, partial [Treponema sp.]|nr:hypothetical protein [Treponema sp.]